MRSRILPRQTSPYARFIQAQTVRQCRSFVQSTRARDGEFKYVPPLPADEQPQPKATIQSKLLAVVIGGGLALAYAAYKQRTASIKPSQASDGFATFTLADKDEVSSTCSIFTLKPLSSRLAAGTKVNADGGIYSIQLKQPQLQIARSYTLLPPIPGEPIDTLRLLIRKEEKGEVSGYLHDLSLGSDIEVRGPYKDYAFSDAKKIIFLAGGTGIAPALKTADALKDRDVHVLWASRHREDCAGGVSDTPPQKSVFSSLWSMVAGQPEIITTERNTVVLLLDLLKRQNEKLKVDYFVDDEQTHIRPSAINAMLSDRGDNVIFVSGPEGFINYWAGPKEFVNGREEQGKLGGALSRMNLQGWQVVKL